MTNAAAASEAVPTAAVTRAAAARAPAAPAAQEGRRRRVAPRFRRRHYRCRRRYRHRHCCHGHRHLRCRRHLKRRYRRRTARSLWPCVGCMQRACRVRCGMPLPVPRVVSKCVVCIQFIYYFETLPHHSTIGGEACDVRPLSSPARRVAARRLSPVTRSRGSARARHLGIRVRGEHLHKGGRDDLGLYIEGGESKVFKLASPS